MASPADAAGPGIGTVVQLGFAAADALNRLIGGGWNKRERQAAAAARDAGYVHTRRGWVDPNGQRVLERDVLAAGAAIMSGQPTITPTRPQPPPTVRGPPPTRPTMPPGGTAPPYQSPIDRRYDTVRDPPKRTPPRAPPPAPRPPPPIIDPNLPYYSGGVPLWARVLGAVGALLYPTPTASDDTRPGPMPGQPTGPTRRPVIRPGQPSDTMSPPSPIDTPVIVTAPRPRPPVLTSPTPQPVQLPTTWPEPTSLPSSPPSSPPSSSPAPSTRSISWPDLLLLPLPFLSPSVRTAAPSPLTQPLPNTPPAAPPLTPIQAAPLAFPQPLPAQSDPCRQNRPDQDRKRKRSRKPRTVCYSGTFQERRKGLTKQRRRKIPCR